jgi:hypothetical protein
MMPLATEVPPVYFQSLSIGAAKLFHITTNYCMSIEISCDDRERKHFLRLSWHRNELSSSCPWIGSAFSFPERNRSRHRSLLCRKSRTFINKGGVDA